MLWAQSTKNDYVGAENKLQSISKLFIPQVIIQQVSLSQTTTFCQIFHKQSNKTHFIFHRIHQSLLEKNKMKSTISEHKPRKTRTHVLEPIHILQALNKETMNRMTYFTLRAHTRTGVAATTWHFKLSLSFWTRCTWHWSLLNNNLMVQWTYYYPTAPRSTQKTFLQFLNQFTSVPSSFLTAPGTATSQGTDTAV